MQNPKIIVCVDDVHPQKGWRIIGDKSFDFFESLNRLFGVKFTIFVPSNYHKEYPLSVHKEYLNELLSIPFFEVAAHGHYHQCDDAKRYGECEFFELQNDDEITRRIQMMRDEWEAVCGELPSGWRSPGWLTSHSSSQQLKSAFKYVAVHQVHNMGLDWRPAVAFYGHTGIHESSIEVQANNTIVFQSHINGDWNDNVWNQKNFTNLSNTLSYLHDIYKELEFKTFKELYEECTISK